MKEVISQKDVLSFFQVWYLFWDNISEVIKQCFHWRNCKTATIRFCGGHTATRNVTLCHLCATSEISSQCLIKSPNIAVVLKKLLKDIFRLINSRRSCLKLIFEKCFRNISKSLQRRISKIFSKIIGIRLQFNKNGFSEEYIPKNFPKKEKCFSD